MICLDSNRNIIKNPKYIEKDLSNKEFLIIEDMDTGKSHFESYHSDKLIYLGEYDLVYSIHDLHKGTLYIAPQKDGKDFVKWVAGPSIHIIQIPQLIKLIDNQFVTKSNAVSEIKERDNYTCQVCGNTDERVLHVHHIVPRKNPIIAEDFINSPINQITLCANCHNIAHHTLKHGTKFQRQELVQSLFDLTGYNYARYTWSNAYCMKPSEFKDWR